MTVGSAYLPVNGFTDISLSAFNSDGEPLSSPYEVAVNVVTQDALPFIELGQANGVIDENGGFKTPILMNEPEPEDYSSLAEIPLQLEVKLEIINPRTKEVTYDTVIGMPLGIALLTGTTLGPGFEPRQEPLPPEFYDPSYQLANQVKEDGHFYILLNASLFDQDVERFKKLAERRQEIFTMEIFDFALEWSQASSTPLRYRLQPTEIEQIKPAAKVSLREGQGFDLLRPEEHESRIRERL